MTLDVALDVRMTSHMSAGMRTYVAELRARLPLCAPDLTFALFGTGDNFDVAEQLSMPAWIAKQKPRLVHYPTPFAPLVNVRPYVLTIHDLIELKFPQFAKGRAAAYYRYITGRLARLAARVICDDERTAADLIRLLGVVPANVRVIALGVDERYLLAGERFAPARPYFLYAGNHRAHKDLPTLFQAWASLPPGAPDLHLTGSDDFGGAVEKYAREDARIVFLGDLGTAQLIDAYRGALALVHPSLMEGFGLPLLEASVLGTPVIAADQCIPGVLRDVAVSYPARDARALSRLLESAARDPSALNARARSGTAAARAFTWDRCARATADVYREVLR